MTVIADLSASPLAELISLEGRCAVVTGAARGIGTAIGSRLMEAGADVVVADLDGALARQRAQELADEHGHKAVGVEVDVRSRPALAALADAAATEFGRLDIWVNNAGYYPAHEIDDITDDEWADVLDINLRGAFWGAREAVRVMQARDCPGTIVNLASVSGYRGRPGQYQAHYAAAKHGVRGLTASLAAELGRFGVRVLGVAPTMTRTPGVEQRGQTSGFSDLAALIESRLPLGRAATPDDIARVVLFCVTGLAGYMTGSTLLADGGDLTVG